MHQNLNNTYDVIVCGSGHAGCEAAIAASKIVNTVLLITGNYDTTGQMSCNPAIGGQAKGQIVREIDALGGEMGINADVTGIQYKLLNSSKGLAVQAPRTQCDKKYYQSRMKFVLEQNLKINIFQAIVNGIIIKNNQVVGVKTNLQYNFYSKAIIITTGTFMRGLMHIGKTQQKGGRMSDFVSQNLSKDFLNLGIKMKRFKTGTPPRILGRSINFNKCIEQKGDKHPTLFSFYDTTNLKKEQFSCFFNKNMPFFHLKNKYNVEDIQNKQRSCWITHTTLKTKSLILNNLNLLPVNSLANNMQCQSDKMIAPRYCPSIEDKYLRFEHKDCHRIFLEPEGIHTDEWYINGFSTCLPIELQIKALQTIDGLENVIMTRPAYAVEYDFACPTQLYASLESKKIENLYFAGQINGTSGYEEAAAQGLIAGVNAANKIMNKDKLIISRNDGYIGVLIDNLITQGVDEPYRMFTSRAENRLLLNHDSAEIRLLKYSEKNNLLNKSRILKIKQKQKIIKQVTDYLESYKIKDKTIADLIRSNNCKNNYDNLLNYAEHLFKRKLNIKPQVLYNILYKGYLYRESKNILKVKNLLNLDISNIMDFNIIKGLKTESIIKLNKIKPINIGQASRISGINPSDISVIIGFLNKKKI